MTTTTRPTTTTHEPAGTEAELAWTVPNDRPRPGAPEEQPRSFVGRLFDAVAHYRYHVRSL